MGKLVDADTIRKDMDDSIEEATKIGIQVDGSYVYYKLLDSLEELPEAVVRCKDCRWGKEACGNIECFTDTNVPPEYHGYEWFCPNGERRTDEQ